MDYTLGTLKDIIKRRLQDQEFDDETLRIFLNDSLNEILGEDKYPFMERIDSYVADEKGEIEIPLGYAGTFYIFARKEGQPREPLAYVAPKIFFENTAKHTMVWTKYANTIFYRIHKDSDGDGFNITHLYLTNPLPLVKETDRTPIPPQFIEALILGAMARAEQYRDNFDYAQIYKNEQDQILTNMKLRYGPGNLVADNQARTTFGEVPHDRI